LTDTQVGNADLTELPPEFRADLVLRFFFGKELVLVIVLEVQLARDDRKHYTWPAYAAVERARASCPALLVVLTLDRDVARWASEVIYDGLKGGVSLRPLVLGPAQIPLLSRKDQARRDPDLALLSLVVHAEERVEIEAAEGAIEGLLFLPEEKVKLYSNLITAVLREACRRGLLEKAMLETINEKYKDILQTLWKEGLQEGLDKGAAKGKIEGKIEGKADSVLSVLNARGVAVSEETEQRIRSCTEPDRLSQWLIRALSATSAADLFV
jgi:predicted transposase YdaD